MTPGKFFVTLGVGRVAEAFLQQNPTTWDTNNAYMLHLDADKGSQTLTVVNDVAERGVAFYQSFNGIILANQEYQT